MFLPGNEKPENLGPQREVTTSGITHPKGNIWLFHMSIHCHSSVLHHLHSLYLYTPVSTFINYFQQQEEVQDGNLKNPDTSKETSSKLMGDQINKKVGEKEVKVMFYWWISVQPSTLWHVILYSNFCTKTFKMVLYFQELGEKHSLATSKDGKTWKKKKMKVQYMPFHIVLSFMIFSLRLELCTSIVIPFFLLSSRWRPHLPASVPHTIQ